MKKLFLSIIFFGILIPISAQKEEPLNKFDIRFGIVDNGRFLNYSGTKVNLRVDFDYNLSKYISLGGYFGYAKLITNSYAYPSAETQTYGDIFFYGINAYYHLSPLFLEPAAQTKFDLYLKGTLGAKSGIYENGVLPISFEPGKFYTSFDYGIYLGASYYPLKRVGLNLEVGYGESYISKIGLTVKLGKHVK